MNQPYKIQLPKLLGQRIKLIKLWGLCNNHPIVPYLSGLVEHLKFNSRDLKYTNIIILTHSLVGFQLAVSKLIHQQFTQGTDNLKKFK